MEEKEEYMYNPDILSERLEDLRKRDGTNAITFEMLSKCILKKTNVRISGSQLCKYENPDKRERMNVNNLLALANFYDVSIEYLLGLSNTKSNNITDQHAAAQFGLSDKSMERLKKLKKTNSLLLAIINSVLENDNFCRDFPELFHDFYEENRAKGSMYFDRKKYDFAKFALCELFKETLDSICDDVQYKRRSYFAKRIDRAERKKNPTKSKKEDKK